MPCTAANRSKRPPGGESVPKRNLPSYKRRRFVRLNGFDLQSAATRIQALISPTATTWNEWFPKISQSSFSESSSSAVNF